MMKKSLLLALFLAAYTTAGAQSGSVFCPADSEFSVTFSGKPVVSEFETEDTERNTVKATRAELLLPDSFQRVELIKVPKGLSARVTKEDALRLLKQYAERHGMQSPRYTWEITDHGPVAHMRATKSVRDKGKLKSATYETFWYFGDSTLLYVHVGGPSSSYPTTKVHRFLKSIKKFAC